MDSFLVLQGVFSAIKCTIIFVSGQMIIILRDGSFTKLKDILLKCYLSLMIIISH